MATKFEYYDVNDDSLTAIGGTFWRAQRFTSSTSHVITKVVLKLWRTGSPGTLTVSIKASTTDGSGKPTGADLCSGTIDGDSLTTSSPGNWYDITLGSGAELSSGGYGYCIVCRALTGSIVGGNYVNWGLDLSGSTYAGGSLATSSDSGSSWNTWAQDVMFEEWGDAFATPTVTTQAVSSILTTTATGNGNITNLGVPNPTAHGVCYNTTGSPTISDSVTDEGAAVATGAFTTNITGLTSGATYYVKAYATNSSGTGYGDQVSFTTDELPTVTTQTCMNVVGTTATGRGNVTDLGSPNPTQHGHVWDTATNPTTALSTKTTLGAKSTTGAFLSDVTNLVAGTGYYMRAYATTEAGTSYGANVYFIAGQTASGQTRRHIWMEGSNLHGFDANQVERIYIHTDDVDDTPVDGATTAPISSNWAYDHVAAADPHAGYVLESLFDADTFLYASSDNTPLATTPANVLAALTGHAAAAFDWNSQNLTSVGTVNTHTIPAGTDTFALLAATQELDNKTLDSSVAKGTWTTSGTWTLPAFTLGGTISGGNQTVNSLGKLGVGDTVGANNTVRIEETVTITDNAERIGTIVLYHTQKTTAELTSSTIALLGRAFVGAANTQNWTAANGLVGVEGAVRTELGSTGTISNAKSLFAKGLEALGGAIVTNWAGLYVQDATVTGTAPTNAYGIYIETINEATTLNYAIWVNGGTSYFGGAVVIADAIDIEIGAAGSIKSGATNGDTFLLKANDTTFITLTTGATDTCTIDNVTLTTPVLASLYQTSGGGLISVPASAGADTVCLIGATQELDGKTLDSSVGKGTWTASGTWTIPAVTLGGTVTLNSQSFSGTAKFSAGIATGGFAPLGYVGNYMAITFTSDGASTAAASTSFGGGLTGASGDTDFLVIINDNGAITTQNASNTIAHVTQHRINEPQITKGATDTITVASTLWIVAAPTEGVTNAAIYVSSGNLILNSGALRVGANQVVGARVVDARCDDAINSGDATTDGVIDALRDAMIAHGLIAAA